MLDYVEMFRGTIAQASVYPREVMTVAQLMRSSSAVLVHNHPPGLADPSRADEVLTQTLKAAPRLIDVQGLDHLIVAGPMVFNFAERGLL